MQATNEIPAGYMKNSLGHLVPVEMVKEIDKLRDELIVGLIEKAQPVSDALKEFKEYAFSNIESFIELSAAEYDSHLGGKKGNVTLYSYDGKYRMVRAKADLQVFDERLQIAKELIDECLNEWTSESGPELKTLVNSAFQVDKEGNVNAKRILALRKHNIEDPRWLKAMSAIADGLTVIGSRAYVRLYERIEDTDKWKPISLDIAGV